MWFSRIGQQSIFMAFYDLATYSSACKILDLKFFKAACVVAVSVLLGSCSEKQYEPCNIAPYTHIEHQLLKNLNENIDRRRHIYDRYGIDYSNGFEIIEVEKVYEADEPDSLNARFTVTDSSGVKKSSLALIVRCELAEHWYPLG